MITILGDTHNFGKYVHLQKDKVVKPRTTVWEYLFLSKTSVLRSLINDECQFAGIASPYSLAPDLQVDVISNQLGHVDYFSVDSLPESYNINFEDVESIGAMIAMSFWFGIGDLHHENIFVGKNGNDLICFPIDIECIFDHLTHLKQNLLLPSEKISPEKCGLAKILNHIMQLPKAVRFALIKSFVDNTNLYNGISQKIYTAISEIDHINHQPIRVIIRDTAFYKKLDITDSSSNLYKSEVIQIARGDIPYYFRFPDSDDIYFWVSDNQFEKADFTFENFDLPHPINLRNYRKQDFLKLKTTILSINNLAKALGLNSSLTRLDSVEVSFDNSTYKFTENESQLILSTIN